MMGRSSEKLSFFGHMRLGKMVPRPRGDSRIFRGLVAGTPAAIRKDGANHGGVLYHSSPVIATQTFKVALSLIFMCLCLERADSKSTSQDFVLTCISNDLFFFPQARREPFSSVLRFLAGTGC